MSEEHHRLVRVYDCADDTEAEIVVAYLKANGIEAIESSNLPHSIYPVTSDAHVLVNEDDAETAIKMLKDRDETAPGTPEEPEEH